MKQWIFGANQFNGVIKICPWSILVAMVTTFWLLEQQIGYNCHEKAK